MKVLPTLLLLYICTFAARAQDNGQQMLKACANGNINVVKTLLKEGVDPSEVDENGAGMWMWAAYGGNIEILKLAKTLKVKIPQKGIIFLDEQQETYYGSALAVAIDHARIDLVQFLVEDAGFNVNGLELDPKTGLEQGWSALHWSAYKGTFQITKYLLLQGADINQLDGFGGSPLYYAVMQGDSRTVELLLEKGADPNQSDNQGWLPIHMASRDGMIYILEYLLKAGAKQDKPILNHFPIHLAVSNNHPTSVKLLMLAGAKAELAGPEGLSASAIARSKNFTDCLEALHNPKKFVDPNLVWAGLTVMANQMQRGMYETAAWVGEKLCPELERQTGKSSDGYIIAANTTGNAYRSFGDNVRALGWYMRAVEFVEQSGLEEESKALYKTDFAASLFMNQEYEKSKTNFLEAGELFEKSGKLQTSNYWGYLMKASLLYQEIGEFSASMIYLQKATELAKGLFGESSEQYAQSLTDLADLLQKYGRSSDCIAFAEAAISIFNALQLSQTSYAGKAFLALAKAYTSTADFENAKLYLDRAEKLFQNSTEYASSYASILSSYGMMYQSADQVDFAEHYYLNAESYIKTHLGEWSSYLAIVYNNLGVLYRDQDKYQKSEEAYQNALKIYEKVYGRDHPKYYTTIGNLALGHLEGYEFEKAEKEILKAREWFIRKYGANHENSLIQTTNLAKLYVRWKRFSEAEKLLLEAQAGFEKLKGQKSKEYAITQMDLGKLYLDWGKILQAKTEISAALEIIKEINGEKSTSFLEGLYAQARFYSATGEFDLVVQNLEKCHQVGKEIYGQMSSITARYGLALAAAESERGNHERSVTLYEQGLKIIESIKGPSHPDFAAALNNFALTQKSIGAYIRAEKTLFKARKILIKNYGSEHPDVAVNLINIAEVRFAYGDFERSFYNFLEAREELKKHYPAYHPRIITANSWLATVAQKREDYGTADTFLEENLKQIKNSLGSQNFSYHSALKKSVELDLTHRLQTSAAIKLAEFKKLTLELHGDEGLGSYEYNFLEALFHVNALNHEDAASSFLISEKALESYTDKESLRLRLEALNLASASIISSNDYPRFIKVSEKIDRIYKSHPFLENDPGLLAMHYANAMKMNMYIKDFKAAAINAEGLLKIEGLEMNRMETYTIEITAAFLYALSHQNDKAIELSKNMGPEMIYWVRSNFSSLPESEKEQLFDVALMNINKLNYILMHSGSNEMSCHILETQLNSKGIIFNETQRLKNLVLASNDEQIVSTHSKLLNNQELIAQLSYLDEPSLVTAGINMDSLRTVTGELERELNRRLALTAEVKHEYVEVKDIQNQLRPNEASVELLKIHGIDSSSYVAIITKKDVAPELVAIGNGNDLDTKYFKYYSNAIKNGLQDQKSFKTYWSDVHKRLDGIEKVYVCPDGIYHKININSLYNSEEEKYVIADYEIHQLTNSSSILDLDNEKSAIKEAVFFGRPKFDMEEADIVSQTKDIEAKSDTRIKRLSRGAVESEWLQTSQFSDLPGTEEEVRTIETELTKERWKVELYLGEQAIEEKLKLVYQPTVLHIATHGFFREKTASNQSMATTNLFRDNSGLGGFKESLDPMLRSGLVLAGAETRHEQSDDGLLTALEASNLNLEGTELVVLSACETGLGAIKENGEGVYGLQRAFRAAGAKSVLMSLWKVDDEATSILMASFYRYWIETGDKRKAFRKAQLELQKDTRYANPLFWGAFVMIGK